MIAYFEEAVKRDRALPTYKWLGEAGIVPSNTVTYTREQIVGALAKKTGAIPFIGCTGRPNRNTLNEFWYYYHVSLAGMAQKQSVLTLLLSQTYGPVRGGVYVATDATFNSTCPTEGIKWRECPRDLALLLTKLTRASYISAQVSYSGHASSLDSYVVCSCHLITALQCMHHCQTACRVLFA